MIVSHDMSSSTTPACGEYIHVPYTSNVACVHMSSDAHENICEFVNYRVTAINDYGDVHILHAKSTW